jgi:hypothetical protein
MSAAPRPPARAAIVARIGVATSAAGIHAELWLTATPAAVTLTLLEAALIATVILTALFAPSRFSTRAFRMLPFTTPAGERRHPPSKPEKPPDLEP